MNPPCSLTIDCEIDSPNPVPFVRVVKNGSNIREIASFGIPRPVSMIRTWTYRRSGARRSYRIRSVRRFPVPRLRYGRLRITEHSIESLPGRHRLDGVADDVQQDLGDLVRVDEDRGDPAPDLGLGRDALVGHPIPLEFEHPLHDLDDRALAEPRPAGVREGQEALDDPVQPCRFVQDDLDEALAWIIGRNPVAQHLRAVADAGQRIADLVRDTGREFSDRSQPVTPGAILLERPLFRCIPDHDEEPAGGLAPVPGIRLICSQTGFSFPSRSMM